VFPTLNDTEEYLLLVQVFDLRGVDSLTTTYYWKIIVLESEPEEAPDDSSDSIKPPPLNETKDETEEEIIRVDYIEATIVKVSAYGFLDIKFDEEIEHIGELPSEALKVELYNSEYQEIYLLEKWELNEHANGTLRLKLYFNGTVSSIDYDLV